MKKPRVIHPFLFAIFPIVFLFAHNMRELSITGPNTSVRFGILIMFSLGVTLIVWIPLRLTIRDRHRTAIFVSMSLLMFFSYGHFYHMVVERLGGNILFTVGGFQFGYYKCYFFLWTVFFACVGYFLFTTHKNVSTFTQALNMLAGTLILLSLINIGVYGAKRSSRSIHRSGEQFNIKATHEKIAYKPDIYYIILDTYASPSTLKELLNYDNHDFLTFLEERGFYIASQSRSNYAFTTFSLASSLNFEYINYLSDQIGTESSDLTIPIQMTANNKAIHFLKSKGYKFIQFSSGYAPTEQNTLADRDIRCNRKFIDDRFIKLFIQMTVVEPFFDKYADTSKREMIQCQFSRLAQLPQVEGPIFVFAHIMLPHPPYVFGENGEEVSEGTPSAIEENQKRYLEQLTFTNKKVKILIDELLSKSENPPIIILQSDHGPYMWGQNPKVLMRILNAYYFPPNDSNNPPLYEAITPVNTFRVIFNAYFGTDYELLDDQSYYSDYWSFPYKLTNVTNEIKSN